MRFASSARLASFTLSGKFSTLDFKKFPLSKWKKKSFLFFNNKKTSKNMKHFFKKNLYFKKKHTSKPGAACEAHGGLL